MPIRPENRKLYPPNWKEISKRIRWERAKGRCEMCGIPNHQIIKRTDGDSWRWPSSAEWDMIHGMLRGYYSKMQAAKAMGMTYIVLTVAHLDHDPSNCAEDNLKALCQRCHNRYDAKMRRLGINERSAKDQLRLL